MHNLGCLEYRRDRIGQAADSFQRAYEVNRAVLGPRHPDLAVTLYARARCLRRLGDRRTAVSLLCNAVDLLQAVVPPSQPTLLACRRELAELLGRPTASLAHRRSRAGWRSNVWWPRYRARRDVNRLHAG
jgi:hypothetical protein